MHKNIAVILLTFVASAEFANAQTGDLFWSAQGLGSGAVNSDLDLVVGVGEFHTLFLYWSTNGPADSDLDTGGGLDITTSQPGIISFDAAETLDFDITVSGIDIDNRWLDDNGGGGFAGVSSNIDADMIDNLIAFTVNGGTGIIESHSGPAFLDAGYDFDSDPFLFATVDFTAQTSAR